MYTASFFKRVVNIPRSLCLVVRGRHVGGVISWGRNDRKSLDEIMWLLDARSSVVF